MACEMHDTIEKAVELHQEHMDNPDTVTPESQQQLMELLQQHQMMMGGEKEAGDGEMESDPYMSKNRMPMNMMKRRAMPQE